MENVTFLGLVGAHAKSTVLENLQKSSEAVKASLNASLNSALKIRLSTMLASAGCPGLAGLAGSMPAADISAVGEFSVQSFLKQQLRSVVIKDPATQELIDQEIGNLTGTETIGNLLGLNHSLQTHPTLGADTAKASLAALLATSPILGPDQKLQAEIINRYSASDGSIQDFWLPLSNDPNFKAAIPELQLTLGLGIVTQNNSALLAALRAKYQLTSVRDLVKLTSSDWTQLITSENIPVPSSVPGATPAEMTANYVRAIMGILRSAYSGDYIRQGLSQRPLDAIDGSVSQFLKNSPDFDFVKTPVNSYLQKNAGALAGIAEVDQAKVTQRIKGYQRLARLNPDFSVMSVLVANGLDSAYKIATTPRDKFLQQTSLALGGSSKAEAIYASAKGATASGLNLYQSVREGLGKVHPGVFGNVSEDVSAVVQQIPDWQELFGSTSGCACQDCTSVLSAAAYLADLLHFLSKAGSDPADPYSPTLLTVLGERRPDLVNLKLNCENTNTMLPYLDLVNEILESVVASKVGQLPTIPAYNTSANVTSDELQVNPEYTKESAYVLLENTFYPFNLPFDRFLDTARTYLEFYGSSLWEVMNTFQVGLDQAVPANTNSNPTPCDPVIAQEYLKISVREALILTGQPFQGASPLKNPSDLSEYYGYSPGSAINSARISSAPNGAVRRNNVTTITTATAHGLESGQLVTIAGVADGSFDGTFVVTGILSPTAFTFSQALSDATSGRGTAAPAPWYVDLAYVPTFLKRTGVTFQDLVSLLETHFLNPAQTITLQVENTQNSCDIDSAVINGLAPTNKERTDYSALHKIYRFIRLRSKLGWQISELDKAIAALGATDIDSLLLCKLSEAKQLQNKWNWDPLGTLALWANLDTEGSESLYVSSFQNAGTLSAVDPGLMLRYTATLPATSTLNLSFLKRFGAQISWKAGQLQFTDSNGIPATMTANQERFLLSLSADTEYQHAIVQLFLQNPAPLASLPAGLVLPAQLPDSIYFQGTQLYFVGKMSDDLRTQLKFSSSDTRYQLAIDNLYEMRWAPGTEVAIATQTLASQVGQLVPAQTIPAHASTIAANLRLSAPDLSAIVSYLWSQSSLSQSAATPSVAGGALGNGTYYVVVSAVDDFGEYLCTDESPAITVTGPSGSIAVSWTAAPGATSYNVYYTLPDAGPGTESLRISSGAPTATITTNAPGGSVSAATPPVNPALPLNLANLSAVYRHAKLAQALGVSIPNLISLIGLTGINPFQLSTPGAPGTRDFACAAQKVLDSEFSVTELEFIYRNVTNPPAGPGPRQDTLDQFVASLQSALAAPAAVPSSAADPSGALLGAYLSKVMSASDAAELMGLIAGTFAYAAPLNALPVIVFPPALSLIAFDSANHQLVCTGPLSQQQEEQLLALSIDPAYQAAVQAIYQNSAPAWAKVYTSVASANPLPVVAFPPALSGPIAYANGNTQLTFTGPMSAAQLDQLTVLSSDPNYQAAVNNIFAQSAPAWSSKLSQPLNALPPIAFPTTLSARMQLAAGNLQVAGALSDADEAALLSLSADPAYQAAIENLYLQPRQFLIRELYFLDTQSLIALLTNNATTSLADKYGFVLNALLKAIGAVVQTVSDSLKLDTALTRLLLVGGLDSAGNALLQSTRNPNLSAIADFFAILGDGLTGTYFPNSGFSGAAAQPQTIEPGINFAWSPTSVPAPGLDSNSFSAKWTGQILGQFTETHTFSVRVVPSSQDVLPFTNPPVVISVRGAVLPLTLSPTPGAGTGPSGTLPAAMEYTGTADLVAGELVAFELDYANSAGATLTGLRLSWSSLSLAKTIISQQQFYPDSSFTLDEPLATYKLLCRIAMLLNKFKATTDDLSYLASNAARFAGINPANPAQTAPFNLNALPSNSSAYSPALFDQWQRLLAFFNLRDSMPGSDRGLLSIFAAASATPPPPVSGLIAPIAAATGWNDSEVGWLLGSQTDPLTMVSSGFGLAAGDFRDERWLVRMQACLALATRFGASAKQLFEWAALGERPAGTVTTNGATVTWVSGSKFSPAWAWATISINGVAYSVQSASSISLTLTGSGGVHSTPVPYYVTGFINPFEANVARDIQAAVKAQYSDTTWTRVGNSLNDKLRESSRDALVAYILANANNWKLTADSAPLSTADELYEYFLIDVQMGSCMQTSRVVQATSTVQLFVQRCLMNLEPQVRPSAIDKAAWRWMQNYRVWQANREVFLFPENYMDPTLRDDKTPFFTELQTELQQNPLTPDTAEQALIDYLEKLDQVARLDIRAMYWNYSPNPQSLPDGTVDSSNDVLHVFGRTPSTPNIYYYRRLLKASLYGQASSPAHWTAWEKVNVDIQGEQLVPVLWDGRLYLFWPIFAESSDPTQPPPASSAPPQKILKIQMAWSRYSEGGWSAKQVSSDSLIPQFYLASLNRFSSQYTGAPVESLFLFTSDTTSTGDLVIRVWTPKWGGQYYGPGNAIPGEGTHPPRAQTDAVFEGDFVFTGCSSDGTITYTDPVHNWTQNTFFSVSGAIPENCQYESDTANLIHGASKLSFWSGNLGPLQYVDFLTRTPSPFRLSPSGAGFFSASNPFVYQDASRVYFVAPMGQTVLTYFYLISPQFVNFWHPHACAFIKTLNQYGIASFLSLLTQQRTNDGGVVSGFELSTSNSLTPGLTPGSLYAQGQLYQTTLPPSVPPMPQSSTQQLFCGPNGHFYYSPHSAANPGDALIGTVTSNANSVIGVVQATALVQPTVFAETYGPNPGSWSLLFGGTMPYIAGPPPRENVDFSFNGAYSIYNWELFFHIPLFMATLFSQNQQFEEAQKWFHYIFNSTTNSNDSVLKRFWNFLPFYECSASDEILGPIETLFRQENNTGLLAFQGPLYSFSTQVNRVTGPTFDSTWVGATIHIPVLGGELDFVVVSVQSSTSLTVSQSYSTGDYQYYVTFSPVLSECREDVQSEVAAWQEEPFDPFLIGRLRTIAFRKTVVMKYLDNLIAWGDFLFAQNTRESINEATQLYVLAQQILGDKPLTMPLPGATPEYSYNGLLGEAAAEGLGDLDDFSNVLVSLENMFPFSNTASPWLGSSGTGPLNSVAASSFYFCIPQNPQLLGYWDTVADRLYKIRHCMSLTGQTEQLALFAPPINPALLVQAAAAGIDLSSVLNDISTSASNYRFGVVVQKALEMCAEVRSLGAALLSALEKNDAEGLSVLRSTQEISLLQAVLQIKQSQIDEANKNVAGLQTSYAVTQFRQQYYQSLLTAGLSAFEQNQVSSLMNAQSFQSQSQTYEIASGLAGMLPNLTVGSSGEMGSPVATATFGGIDLQAILSAQSRALAALASSSTYAANMMGLTGGWDRRSQDWGFQQQLAAKELIQIQNQIDAATVRVQIAQSDLQNQQLQISNSQAVLDFLNGKYTNQELYGWMIAQLSAVYFQCYQMAYGLAKRAESCFRFELGLPSSSFIHFGYWDSLRKGLLAGEGLYCDLKRMELAYLDQNQREFEITKYISLVLLDPLALITLKETGQCVVSLPEALFDMDYPGQYMRRLKSVSLTIPCVAGPYTSINCKLTLVSSQIRTDNVASSPQDYTQDSHFITNLAATQSIATSSAQNDSGMFELNFRDERYLPFEGAGAVAQWLIELPLDCNAFDFETISDVVINLRYTARDGGDALKAIAKQAAMLPGPTVQLSASLTSASFPSQNNLVRFFSLRHEFPTEWYKFLNPLGADTAQTMMLALTGERFPFQYRGRKIGISQVDLLLKFKDIKNAQLFKTGTPLGDFGTTGLLNVYLTPSASAPGQQPKPPTQPVPNSKPIGLKSTSVNFDGVPYGTGPVISGLGLLWLQVFTTGSYIGNVPSTLLDGDHHLLARSIEDIFMVCHYSLG